MTAPATMADLLALSPVIPVLTISRVADAVPLAEALVGGGLPVLEVTLRTEAALAATAAIRGAVPAAVVGVGTVTDRAELAAAADSGAHFAVSPGFDRELAAAGRAGPLPYLPAVATASEVMQARHLGFTALKLFPAEVAGGIAALRSFAGPFPDIRFCPTGGIGPDTMAAYLALPNVICVGGSWLAPEGDLEGHAWDVIRARAAQASGA